MYSKYDLIIGIDPGVRTGIAIWSRRTKQYTQITTLPHHYATQLVASIKDLKIFIRFEDARLRKWFGKSGPEVQQGAGSVKRDSQLWQEWCEMNNIPFEAVAPKDNRTKLDAATFKTWTGWKASTNEHGRDAAMLVYGL